MYFAILTKETIAKIGSVFVVQKAHDNMVNVYKIDHSTRMPIISSKKTFSREHARSMFTKPSTDFDDVIEHAIMICEGAYC